MFEFLLTEMFFIEDLKPNLILYVLKFLFYFNSILMPWIFLLLTLIVVNFYNSCYFYLTCTLYMLTSFLK